MPSSADAARLRVVGTELMKHMSVLYNAYGILAEDECATPSAPTGNTSSGDRSCLDNGRGVVFQAIVDNVLSQLPAPVCMGHVLNKLGIFPRGAYDREFDGMLWVSRHCTRQIVCECSIAARIADAARLATR